MLFHYVAILFSLEFEKTGIPFTQGCFVWMMWTNGSGTEDILKIRNIFLLYCYYSPLWEQI